MSRSSWALVMGLASLAAAVSVPNFNRTRFHPPSRACFANQKTLEGSLEMYALDTSKVVGELNPTFFTELKHLGYLQSEPTDPGLGPGSVANYQLVKGAVVCLRHGFIRPPPGCDNLTPAREQLRAAGVTEPELLARASDQPPFRAPFTLPMDTALFLSWTLSGAAALALAVPLLERRRDSPCGTSPLRALARLAAPWRRPVPTRAPTPTQDADQVAVVLLGPTRLTLARAACPICGQGFDDGGPTVTCRACDAPHHAECWDYAGGCATYGCCENAVATAPGAVV